MTAAAAHVASAAAADPAGRASPDYLVLGHVTLDVLEDRFLSPGGTATYAALTIAGFGGLPGILTSASYEASLVNPLSVRGVRVARLPAAVTTRFANRYQPGGGRQQVLEARAEALSFDHLLPEWRNAPIVHLAPVCQEIDGSIAERFPRSLVCATAQGWLRAWDEAGVVRSIPWDDAERVLPHLDALVVSEADLPDQSLPEAWVQKAHVLVVTRGARGCDVYRREDREVQHYHSDAFRPTRESDPTGAGDVFAATFFWHLHQSAGNWREAADRANCAASFAVEKRGIAGIPSLKNIERRLKDGKRIRAGGTGVPPALTDHDQRHGNPAVP